MIDVKPEKLMAVLPVILFVTKIKERYEKLSYLVEAKENSGDIIKFECNAEIIITKPELASLMDYTNVELVKLVNDHWIPTIKIAKNEWTKDFRLNVSIKLEAEFNEKYEENHEKPQLEER